MLSTETSVQCPTSCFVLTFFPWDIALPASKARLNAVVARVARMLRRSMVFLSLERRPGGDSAPPASRWLAENLHYFHVELEEPMGPLPAMKDRSSGPSGPSNRGSTATSWVSIL